MRTFAGEWPDESIVQQVAAQLPWGHHMVFLDRIKSRTTREWYLCCYVRLVIDACCEREVSLFMTTEFREVSLRSSRHGDLLRSWSYLETARAALSITSATSLGCET